MYFSGLDNFLDPIAKIWGACPITSSTNKEKKAKPNYQAIGKRGARKVTKRKASLLV